MKNAQGTFLINQREMETKILGFFDRLYRFNVFLPVASDELRRFSPISILNCSWLERKFEEAKIWQAVKDHGKNKAPSPYGFTI